MNVSAGCCDYRMRAPLWPRAGGRMRILILASVALLVLLGIALLAGGVNPECGQVVSYGPKHLGCSGMR